MIKNTIKEYKGHHTMKNASPRPFIDDNDEIENYTDKGAPFGGAEGQHTRGMEKRGVANPNIQKQVRF
mgnify:FL=1